jgi:hypothetical protein
LYSYTVTQIGPIRDSYWHNKILNLSYWLRRKILCR